MNAEHARRLLLEVAAAWRSGDPGAAAARFAADALYLEPPMRQRYRGFDAILEFFGGQEPEPIIMSMEWHGIGYDASTMTAYGEYTFRGRRQFHGVAVVQFRDELIASWREYQYESELPFETFTRG